MDDVNIVQIVNIHARVALITKRTKSERNGNSICFERLCNPRKARSNGAKILSNPMNWNFPKVVTRAKDKSQGKLFASLVESVYGTEGFLMFGLVYSGNAFL